MPFLSGRSVQSIQMMIDNKIKYVECEPWMHDHIAELSVMLYGGNVDDRKIYYDHLLTHHYSLRHPPITVVGLSEEDKVIAFQMYFYWPYKKKDKYFNVYQSGNSMVHPGFRGQKIFQKMLSIGSEIGLQKKVDFFIGYPVPISYGALINDGWIKLGNLRWWTKVLRPIGLLKEKYKNVVYDKYEHVGLRVDINKIHYYSNCNEAGMRMVNSLEFLEWQYAQKEKEHWYYEHQNSECMIVYKLSHAHGYSEIIIGDSFTINNKTNMFADTLNKFLNKKNKSLSNIQAISFASFNPSPSKIRGLLFNGFVPHKLTAPLLIKPFSKNIQLDKNQWEVSLGDIDTW